MRQRLLQHLSFAKPLRLALVLLTLLLTLPQTAMGATEVVTKTITFNKTINTVNSGINNSTMSVSINEQITGVASPSYDGEITILDNINGINSYSCSANGAVFKMNGSSTNSTFSLKIPGNYPAKPSKVIVKAAYANGALASNSLYYFKIGVDDEYGDTYHYKLTTGPSNDNVEAEFTADGSPRTNRNSEGPLIVDFVIKAIDTQSENDRTTITVKEISITYTREVYGITVAGTSVKSDNATDILGDGKVSYNATNNTLTLNGATINYTTDDVIVATNTSTLNVNLLGTNSISCGGHFAFNISNNLNFQSSGGVSPGQLTITSTSNIDPQSYYTRAGSVTYENGLIATNLTSSSVLISTNYGINVGGRDVNSTNATTGISIGNGKVYYDVSNNILTLDGADIDGMIKTELESLTINLKGANTISTTTSNFNNGIYSDKNTGTLTFTKEGTNASLTIASNVSVIRGFASLDLENSGLYTNTSTPYKIKSDSSYPRLADATTSDADTTAIKSITISDVATYQLWVAGNQATYSNASNVTGAQTPTVAFNATDNILTLNAATITGIIESSLGDLTIHLTGVNTIKAPASPTSTITSLINSTNAGTLTFETDATTGNRLDFQQSDGSSFSAIPINGFTVAYEAGLGYYSSQIKETLFIEYNNNRYKLHSSNANDIVGDGKVSFSYDSTNGNVLTLNNANIEFIEMLIENDLTIALNGTCTIFNTGHTNAINSWGNLKFVKASGATSAELSASTIYYAPIASTGLTLGSGLYLKPISDVSTTITDDPNFVIIEDYAMDDSKTINGTTGTITYNSTDKVLTINGFQKDFGAKHAIKTGVTGLKVKLIGESTINCAADSVVFYAFCNSASIQFIKNDETSKLTMTGKAFDKFVADNVTYDGLVYYSTNKYIAIPTAPTMDVDNNNKVVLTINYSGGTIATKYSIAYADGKTADETNATYSAPFEMAAPGTVTAWVEANGATTSTVKGKKFGYQGAPLSMMVNEELTPVLIPSIESGDGIDYSTTTAAYESSDTNIATFANKKINSVAIGTVTLTTRLATNNNTIALLNHNGEFTTQLTVSKVFNVTFAEGANYMIYYNSAHDNLTIPDGMTAAIVTGVASSGTTVETAALTFIPETSAVLLGKGTSTGTPTVTKYNGNDTAPTGNKLKYVDNTPVATTGYEYVLYKDEFVKATGSIPDGKCYLDLTGAAPAPAPARSLGIDNDGTTDIHLVNSEEGIANREVWYDLQGRRIEQPTKAGLYIKNGKKVIVNTK